MFSPSQRLDKWLWFSRLVKTRSQASRLIAAGKVRVNRRRVIKPASTIREDDVITAVINRRVRVVKVLNTGRRRGPAREAQDLYKDMTPEEPRRGENTSTVDATMPCREKGTGRPTKRERRQIDAIRGRPS